MTVSNDKCTNFIVVIPMASTSNIIRESFFTFLRNYRYFVSTPTLLAFPYAASYLLTQSVVSSSHLFPIIHNRVRFLFLAARFPLSSQHFTFLCFKLSKTILSLMLISPFTFSFLLLARASVIVKALDHRKPAFHIFSPLLITEICSTIVMLAGNAICFFIFAFLFVAVESLGFSSSQVPILFLSAAGAVIYSFTIQTPQIVCNVALISSGMESRGGFISIAITRLIIKCRATTALFLAVATNLALSAVEALFHYRVVRAYGGLSSGLHVAESVFIAFLYALILVLDTVVGCVFWRRCKRDEQIHHEDIC